MVVLVGVSLLSGRDEPAEPTRRGDGLVAADVDRDTPVPQPPALADGTDLAAWSASAARRSGVPARALRAYAAAELAQRADAPDCRLSWSTIAGIGRVESDHGRLGRRRAWTPTAWPVRGSSGSRWTDRPGCARSVDTDGGRARRRHRRYDRAVGPMQFLPGTWARYGADGNGDGVRDPAPARRRGAGRGPLPVRRRPRHGQPARAGGTACSPTTARATTPAWSGPPPTATPPPTPARECCAGLERGAALRTRGEAGPSSRPRRGRAGRRRRRSRCARCTPSSRRCWPAPAASARTGRAGRA